MASFTPNAQGVSGLPPSQPILPSMAPLVFTPQQEAYIRYMLDQTVHAALQGQTQVSPPRGCRTARSASMSPLRGDRGQNRASPMGTRPIRGIRLHLENSSSNPTHGDSAVGSSLAAQADGMGQAVLQPELFARPHTPEGGVLDLEAALAIQESIAADQQKAVLDARNVQETLDALDPQEVIALARAICGVERQSLNECKRILCDENAFEAFEIDFEKQPICLKAIVDLMPGERSNVDKADRVLCYFYHMFSGAKEINASGLGFEEMPQMMACFPYLQKVDLSYNRLTAVPRLLEGQGSPSILDLSNNQIADSL